MNEGLMLNTVLAQLEYSIKQVVQIYECQLTKTSKGVE